MTPLYQKYGFTKMLSLGHVGWLFLLPWIYLERLPMADPDSGLAMWLKTLLVLNGISLMIDIKEVIGYFFLGKNQITYVWEEEGSSKSKTK